MKQPSTGILTNTTPVVIGAGIPSCPATITLNSSAAGRKIELSTNNGVEYFTPDADLSSSTTMLIVTVAAPFTHARLTGESGDKWSWL